MDYCRTIAASVTGLLESIQNWFLGINKRSKAIHTFEFQPSQYILQLILRQCFSRVSVQNPCNAARYHGQTSVPHRLRDIPPFHSKLRDHGDATSFQRHFRDNCLEFLQFQKKWSGIRYSCTRILCRKKIIVIIRKPRQYILLKLVIYGTSNDIKQCRLTYDFDNFAV